MRLILFGEPAELLQNKECSWDSNNNNNNNNNNYCYCILIDFVFTGDRNDIAEEAEKIIKYKELII